MASVYRRCRRCRGTSKLPEGVRICPEHGKGTIVWTGQADVSTPGGKRKRRSLGYHETKAEAEAVAAELAKAHRQGTLAERTNTTLGEWLDTWIEGPARLRVRPTTLRSYRFQVTAVKKHLGEIPLQKLTLGHIQRFYVHLIDEGGHGLTATTARRYHALLRRALAVALQQGLVDRNVLAVEGAFEMRTEDPEHVVWTVEQLNLYLTTAMNYRLGSLLWVLTFTGARRGEVVGMQWQDVDLEAGEWHVRRAQLITGPGVPKSKAGRRIVGLDLHTIEVLRAWRIRQRDELLASGINPKQHPELPVFSAPGSVKPLYPDTVSRLDVRVREAAGLPPMRMHGLRHLHGSFLVKAGESLKAVSTRLGHSSPAFTLSQYVRDLPGESQQLASTFSSLMDDVSNQ